jgi:hypothetical protein
MISDGTRKSTVHTTTDIVSIENDSERMKSTFFDKGRMRYTEKDATSIAIARAFCPYTLIYRSAIAPPSKLPTDNPRRVIPMTDVHVKIDEPIIGATILDEIISTVIKANPDIKVAR